VAYKFQTRNNKVKLLMEYESVTQEVLLPENQYCGMLNNFIMCAFHGTQDFRTVLNSLQVFFSICGVTVSIAATILSFSS
jgi:hypothetical protein